MQKPILPSANRLATISSAFRRRWQHTEGYEAMGSFHSENVDVLMAQTDAEYITPSLPFDSIPSSTDIHPSNERDLFLLDPKWTFLNHGAFGASLRVGYERAEQWRYHLERQPLRYFDRDLLPHLVYSARQLAGFCQASNREALTLIPNVTYGLNTVIQGYVKKYQSDAHIILWDTSYGSLKKMAVEYCDKVTEVPVSGCFNRSQKRDNHSDIFKEALLGKLSGDKASTKNALLILDQTTSNTAINMPLHSLSELAKKMEMLVMVDGAHGLLASPITLDETLPVDFYLSNGHKWLSCPRGVAMMYCPSKELRETVLRQPAVISHGIGQGYQSRFLWDGCRDYAAALSIPAVLDFWRSRGVDPVRQANKQKLHEAVALLGHAWHGRIDDSVTLVPLGLHSPMMALVRLPESYQTNSATSEDAKRVQDMLFDHFIEVPIKCINNTLYVRISCHIYNQLSDYERLGEVVLKQNPNS